MVPDSTGAVSVNPATVETEPPRVSVVEPSVNVALLAAAPIAAA